MITRGGVSVERVGEDFRDEACAAVHAGTPALSGRGTIRSRGGHVLATSAWHALWRWASAYPRRGFSRGASSSARHGVPRRGDTRTEPCWFTRDCEACAEAKQPHASAGDRERRIRIQKVSATMTARNALSMGARGTKHAHRKCRGRSLRSFELEQRCRRRVEDVRDAGFSRDGGCAAQNGPLISLSWSSTCQQRNTAKKRRLRERRPVSQRTIRRATRPREPSRP